MSGLTSYLLGVLVVLGVMVCALAGVLVAGVFYVAIMLPAVISLVRVARWMDARRSR